MKRSVLRLVLMALVALLGWLQPAALADATAPSRVMVIQSYDASQYVDALNEVADERGPPTAYDYATHDDADAQALVGPSAGSDRYAIWGTCDYDDLIRCVPTALRSDGAEEQVGGAEPGSVVLPRSDVAAKFGSGSGPWTEGVGARSGGAIGQATEASCVSACGAMLSGRTHAELLEKLGDWSNPQALARELGDGWTGGFFGSADDAIAAASRGPMGATLQAGTGPGHMVVTSPLGEGRFLVRDPWAGGSTYEVSSDWISQCLSGGVFR